MPILRAFIPLDGARHNHAACGLVRFLNLRSLERRSSEPLQVFGLRRERLAGEDDRTLNITAVEKGAKVVTVRRGKQQHVSIAKATGLMLDVTLATGDAYLSLAKRFLANGNLGLIADIVPGDGCWRDEVHDRERQGVYHATSAGIRQIRLSEERPRGQIVEIIE